MRATVRALLLSVLCTGSVAFNVASLFGVPRLARQPLASVTMLSEGPAEDDWRAFRAQLVSLEQKASGSRAAPEVAGPSRDLSKEEWVHPAIAEPGCLLLANPVKFKGTQSYFARAVVLLVEHDDAGSIGFMLNRASPYTVNDIVPSLGLFARCPIHIGGPVGDGLQFIHSLPEVHGSREIMKGVFYGGDLAHAAYLIKQQSTSMDETLRLAKSFHFFYKYCRLQPAILARDVRAYACARRLHRSAVPNSQTPRHIQRAVPLTCTATFPNTHTTV